MLPQTRSSSTHAVESTCRVEGVKLFKNNQILGWVVLPQTRPISVHGVEEPFRLDVLQPVQKHSSWWLGRAPQHSLSRPSLFRGVKPCFRFDVMQICNSVQVNGWSWSPKHGPAQITLLSQLIVRMAWSFFKNIQNLGWVVLPQTRPSSIHGVEEPFRLDVMQPFQKLSSWWLGRAPQHPLSRPSSFRGVTDSFRFDVVKIFNKVQMNGWSCSPKHGPT